MDFHKGEAVAHGMGAGDDELSAYFASTNNIERDDTPFVTFSHYAPRFECAREKRFLLEPCLAKVSGSDHLGDLVLSLKPDVHVFGHTHIPIDIDLDGTYYVQWPLGSPQRASRQCARAKALGPLEIYSTARTGVKAAARPRPARPSGRRAWVRLYSEKPRTPSVTEPAPWVASYRKRRAKKVREPRVPNHAGYDDEVAALSRRSIVERLEGWTDGRRHAGLRRGVCELAALVCAPRFFFVSLCVS